MTFHFSTRAAYRTIQTFIKLRIYKWLLVVLEIYLAKLYDWRVPPDLVSRFLSVVFWEKKVAILQERGTFFSFCSRRMDARMWLRLCHTLISTDLPLDLLFWIFDTLFRSFVFAVLQEYGITLSNVNPIVDIWALFGRYEFLKGFGCFASFKNSIPNTVHDMHGTWWVLQIVTDV